MVASCDDNGLAALLLCLSAVTYRSGGGQELERNLKTHD